MQTPIIATERLVLSPPETSDIPAIVPLANDFDVAKWLARMPHPYAEADAIHFVDTIVPSEAIWKIASRDDNTFLGVIGLTPRRAPATFELGYWIGRPYWGVGFASEAGRAIVQHAFSSGNARTLTSGCFVGNDASYRVLTKLGFVECGRSKQFCLAQDEDLEHHDFILSFAQYEAAGAHSEKD